MATLALGFPGDVPCPQYPNRCSLPLGSSFPRNSYRNRLVVKASTNEKKFNRHMVRLKLDVAAAVGIESYEAGGQFSKPYPYPMIFFDYQQAEYTSVYSELMKTLKVCTLPLDRIELRGSNIEGIGTWPSIIFIPSTTLLWVGSTLPSFVWNKILVAYDPEDADWDRELLLKERTGELYETDRPVKGIITAKTFFQYLERYRRVIIVTSLMLENKKGKEQILEQAVESNLELEAPKK